MCFNIIIVMRVRNGQEILLFIMNQLYYYFLSLLSMSLSHNTAPLYTIYLLSLQIILLFYSVSIQVKARIRWVVSLAASKGKESLVVYKVFPTYRSQIVVCNRIWSDESWFVLFCMTLVTCIIRAVKPKVNVNRNKIV